MPTDEPRTAIAGVARRLDEQTERSEPAELRPA
jgi:hypothetical protein